MHAKDQRVSFECARDLPSTAWTHGAQRHLPDTISIRAAWRVPEGYDARGHVVAKTYRYRILLDPQRDPFWVGRAWRVPELDRDEAIVAMQEEARAAVGPHDFAAFRGASDERTDTNRNLTHVTVARSSTDARLLEIDVRGDRFLFNMVRILVGTLVDVGRRRKDPGAIARALGSKDRRDAGITAPPEGLYLERYELDDDAERS